MSLNEFLQKQKEFLVEKTRNEELEWQDLTDMRTTYYGVAEARDTVRKGAKIINEYINAGWDIVAPEEFDSKEKSERLKSFAANEDGSYVSDRLIEICEGQDITPEFLLKAHNLPPSDWKIIAYRNNYWHSQIQGGKRLIMYQSRVTVKPYGKDEISPEWLKNWFEQFEPKPIAYSKVTPEYGSGDNCLVMPIVDLHYNLLSTRFITGNEYNCQIAKDKFLSVVDDVIERVKNKKLSKIIFPIGNDLFNANGINGTTFKGTPQNNEKDIREAYVELFNIMVFALTKLSEIAPVEALYIPSNHDKEVTFYFMHNLYTQFKNSGGRVNVDYSPVTKKYFRFGNTLMMFQHDAKIDKTGNVVIDEAGDILAGSKYINVFLSHLHTEIVRQERNITVRRLPTISGKSSWSCENNYGSNSVSQSFIINDIRNITDIMYTSV
jgi:hypothetical protein